MSALRITAFLVAIALSSSSVVQSPNKRDGTFELLILHNNDMHARFEQTSQLSSTCTTANREAGKCYGGFPRVAHVVKEARKAAASGEGPPVLYLNAGDTYTGTAWFTIYKWKIAAEFINALQPDAVSLGNNDLMRGSNKISPLLNHLQSPILATNVMVKNEQAMNKIRKSLIVNIEGKKVALLGYLTPERNLLDNTDNIEYIDEVLALKEEVDKLRALNVDIIIVLGHSTDDSKNLEIATEVDGIDLVIAGRKNTFAWDGRTIDAEIKPNPVFITQASGKRVLVVQSHSYDKYLGSLIVTFNSDGDIAKYSDNSILLDETVRQDKDAVQIVVNTMEEITEPSSEVIGFTAVVLDGESCKTAECNLGNLITDAIMYYYAVNYEGDTWTDAPIAIIHSGAIGASIFPSVRPASITRGDLMRALPFESKLVAVTMNGTTLKQVLEHAVANYSIENPSNHFLQFSGLRVEYDLSKEPGNRLLTAVARCWSCFVPVFFAIENFTSYKVLMPFALANGEFGYSMLDHLPTQELPYDEFQCVTEFISQRSPVYPEVAERLVLFGLDSLEVNSTVSPTEITATPTAESTTVELSTSVLTETTTEEILEITTEQILETTTGTDSAAAITSTIIVVISVFITMVIS